jgi:hypothetical protein
VAVTFACIGKATQAPRPGCGELCSRAYLKLRSQALAVAGDSSSHAEDVTEVLG